ARRTTPVLLPRNRQRTTPIAPAVRQVTDRRRHPVCVTWPCAQRLLQQSRECSAKERVSRSMVARSHCSRVFRLTILTREHWAVAIPRRPILRGVRQFSRPSHIYPIQTGSGTAPLGRGTQARGF